MSEVYSLMEVYHQVYQPQDVNEDFNDWVNFLIQEGYDLDEYTDEELLEAYYGDLDEANRGDDEVTSHMFTSAEHIKDAKKYRRQGSAFRGVLHPNDWNTQGEPIRQRQHRERRGVKTKGTGIREEVDLYDIISNYLVSEGFCESYEDADVIMANMSEEWREDILDEVVGFGGKVDPNTGKWDTDAKPTPAQQRRKSGSPTRSSNVRGGSHRYFTNASGYHNQIRNETRPEGSGTGLSMSPVQRAKLAAGRAKRKGQGKRANEILTKMGI